MTALQYLESIILSQKTLEVKVTLSEMLLLQMKMETEAGIKH